MNIVITSPIPEGGVGGPASIVGHLQAEFTERGDHVVVVAPSRRDMRFPSLLRQFLLFFRIFRHVARANVVLALDPVSTGFPAVVAAGIGRKPVVLRVGGDFLWESFVERTKESVLLSEFYTVPRVLSLRERMIRLMTNITVSRCRLVVFTTKWQCELWSAPYGILQAKTSVVANALPVPAHAVENGNDLLALGRDTTLKNIALLERVWERVASRYPGVTLRTGTMSAQEYIRALSRCRGVIQPSISEVSPNTILEAIAYGKPFVTTEDTGIRAQYQEKGSFIDTRDEGALERAIISLLEGSVALIPMSGAGTRTWKIAAQEWRTALSQSATI